MSTLAKERTPPQPDRPERFAQTARTTLKRRAARGSYERAAARAILDEGLICHVAFVADGAPVVIPTAYARVGDFLYLHGSTANRMLRSLLSGAPACITVTLVDGLVLARSAFHHSMNYRCVVIFGSGEKVTDPAEHAAALAAVVEHIVPGRGAFVRPPSREESLQTMVVRFPIEEASVKERRGGPIEEPTDLGLEVWAGTIPIALSFGTPEDDPADAPLAPVPAHASGYHRPRAAS